MLLTERKSSDINPNTLYLISCYHTHRNSNCKCPIRQEGNQFVLEDGEIDHCQFAGNYFGSLHLNA